MTITWPKITERRSIVHTATIFAFLVAYAAWNHNLFLTVILLTLFVIEWICLVRLDRQNEKTN